MLTANTCFVRVLYNLRYQGKGIYQLIITVTVKKQTHSCNYKMVVLICHFMLFIYVDAFDYVSTQEFGNIVSETFNIEMTHMQFSHELL